MYNYKVLSQDREVLLVLCCEHSIYEDFSDRELVYLLLDAGILDVPVNYVYAIVSIYDY